MKVLKYVYILFFFFSLLAETTEAKSVIPILKDGFAKEATQPTPEDWETMNNPDTDPGKQKHLYSRGTVRTVTSVVLSGKLITKLPQIADDLIVKMSRAEERLRFKNIADLKQDLQQNLEGLLDKIKTLPEKGKDFLSDFSDAKDEILEAFLRNPELVESWKKLLHSDIPDAIRKNPTYLSTVSKQFRNYGDDVVFRFERVLPNIKQADYDKFFEALNNPKSIDHIRSLVGDFENIPGISLTKHGSNGLPESSISSPGTWANPLLDLSSDHAPNFTNATAKTLSPGTKIYRVIGNRPAGGYWSYEIPKSKAELFGSYAVRPEWNDATKYIEYIVPSEGLKVWEGPTSRQKILDAIEDVTLPGGGIQIYVPDPYRQVGNAFDNLNLINLNLQ